MKPELCEMKGKYLAHIENNKWNYEISYNLRILFILKTEWYENVPRIYIYDR